MKSKPVLCNAACRLIALVAVAVFPFDAVLSQQLLTPSGEKIVGDIHYVNEYLEATNKNVYYRYEGNMRTPTPVFTAPEGTDIIAIALKVGPARQGKIPALVLLSDGSVYLVSVGGHPVLFGTIVSALWGTSPVAFAQLAGDALYAISSSAVLVSRDSAVTWQADTTNLSVISPNSIALDSSQFVYLAQNNGLFKQSPDSSIWQKLTSYPESYALAVFVDRMNRVYASSQTKAYVSTDLGSTWTQMSAAAPVGGILHFGDDAFGNIYAATSLKMYRSVGGTQSWSRIDQPITALCYNSNSLATLFTGVTGDTVVAAETAFGLFISTDQGTSWQEANQGIAASIMYGLERLSSGRLFVSTSLGIFSRNAGDTIWTKSYPPAGYLAGCPLFRDNSDDLFTQGLPVNPSLPFGTLTNWKSTDGGNSWFPDTDGASQIHSGIVYFVDETGTQHYATYDGFNPNILYAKKPGSPWTVDTSGYKYFAGELPTIFGTDRNGGIYAGFSRGAGVGILWRRATSGGSWAPDTSGLKNNTVYALTADLSGNPLAGTYGDGLYKRTAGTWSKLSSPPGLESSSPFAISVDGSGAIFIDDADFAGRGFAWHGVYFTTDGGADWTYAGLNGVSMTALKSYGDTTNAVTSADGIFLLTRTGATGVPANARQPSGFALLQNYPNPFNPTTTIEYTIGGVVGSTNVKLVVYDILGREVATLVNERMQPGTHSVTFDGSGLASGVYFYQIHAGGFVQTRKLLLVK